TKDALIERTVAPSAGASTTRFENLGSIKNTGWEGTVNAQLLRGSLVRWDISFAGSHNTNVIDDLGGVPPIIGTTISQKQGYPLQSYWVRPYTFADADNNGLITVNEVTVG